ncbi:MAG: tripartite tricarboxylate transporter TctB family protein, partial [Candidatus Paceibacterota bacterium]
DAGYFLDKSTGEVALEIKNTDDGDEEYGLGPDSDGNYYRVRYRNPHTGEVWYRWHYPQDIWGGWAYEERGHFESIAFTYTDNKGNALTADKLSEQQQQALAKWSADRSAELIAKNIGKSYTIEADYEGSGNQEFSVKLGEGNRWVPEIRVCVDEWSEVRDEPAKTSVYYIVNGERVFNYKTDVEGGATRSDIIPEDAWEDMVSAMRKKGMTEGELAQLAEALNRPLRQTERTYEPYVSGRSGKTETYYYLQDDPVREYVIMTDDNYITVNVGWDNNIRAYQKSFLFNKDTYRLVGVVDNFRFEDQDNEEAEGPFTVEQIPNISRVYDTYYSEQGRSSQKQMGLRMDGRLYFEVHSGKFGRDASKQVFYNSLELPINAVIIDTNGVIFGPSVGREYDYYVVFVSDRPGYYWVWTRDIDDNGLSYAFSNFVNGTQISDNPKIQIMTYSQAENLGQRGGSLFQYGRMIFKKVDRYTPVSWVDYRNGIAEYFQIHFREHVKNNWIYNLFIESKERGTLAPLVTLIVGGTVIITIGLPFLLWFTTSLISRIFFNKAGKKKSGKNGEAEDKSKKANESESAGSSEERKRKQALRIRVADINRHLYLVKSFSDYLLDLYTGSGKHENRRDLINRYYPEGHPSRKQVEGAEKAVGEDKKKALDFIDNYFIKPISYFFIVIMADQAAKWKKDMAGDRDAMFEGKEDYFVFTDRDLRRVFDFAGKEGIDPVTKFGFNKCFVFNEKDEPGVDLYAWYANSKDNKGKPKKIVVEDLISGMKKWLRKEYKDRKLKQPTFPTKAEMISNNKFIKLIPFAVGALGLFVSLSSLSLGVFGGVCVGLIGYILIKQLIDVLPYIKFHVIDWSRAIFLIIKAARKGYNGSLPREKIKEKEKFFRKYFAMLALYGALLVGLSVFYGWGVIPWFGWIAGGFILLLTLRESMRSWWYLFIESTAASLERNQKWYAVNSAKAITETQLKRIREKDSYFQLVYLDALIEATLRKHCIVYGITPKQAKELKGIATNTEMSVKEARRIIGSLNEQAQEEIIKFFNKIETTIAMTEGETMQEKEDNFQEKLDAMSLKDLVPVIFKGTGKKRIIPSVAFLDGEPAELAKLAGAKTGMAPGLLKAPFRILKENYGDSWEIFLREKLLINEKDNGKLESLISKLKMPEMTLKETISEVSKFKGEDDAKEVEDEIILEWVIYRADGYLKTLLYAEAAGESAYAVFIKYKIISKWKGEN